MTTVVAVALLCCLIMMATNDTEDDHDNPHCSRDRAYDFVNGRGV